MPGIKKKKLKALKSFNWQHIEKFKIIVFDQIGNIFQVFDRVATYFIYRDILFY